MEEETFLHNHKIASKTQRAIAFIIDTVIILFFTEAYYILIEDKELLSSFEQDYGWYELLKSIIISFVLGAITYPLLIGNLGHKILNLKVININTGKEFKKFYEGGIREFLKSLLSNLIIPSLWLLFDKRNQNLYDKITKTVVVENK